MRLVTILAALAAPLSGCWSYPDWNPIGVTQQELEGAEACAETAEGGEGVNGGPLEAPTMVSPSPEPLTVFLPERGSGHLGFTIDEPGEAALLFVYSPDVITSITGPAGSIAIASSGPNPHCPGRFRITTTCISTRRERTWSESGQP